MPHSHEIGCNKVYRTTKCTETTLTVPVNVVVNVVMF